MHFKVSISKKFTLYKTFKECGDVVIFKYKRKKKIAIFLLSFFVLMTSVMNYVAAEVDMNLPQIVGKYAVSIDAKTGEVLYEKAAHDSDGVYPASITKVLTALLLVEEIGDEELITMSPYCVGQVRSNSQILFAENEKLSKKEALFAMMVISANDVACAVAEHIGGTEAGFGEMMTKRARELGAENSNFITASGLHHPGHYTSAYDMALIGKKAIEYDIILEAMGTKRYTLTTSEQTKEIVNPSKIHNDPEALGGKTGYTDAARNTLMKIDEVDGKRVLNVVMRSNLNSIYDDIKKVSNYSLAQLENKLLIDKDNWSKTLTFYDKEVLVKPEKTLYMTKKIKEENEYSLDFVPTSVPEKSELIQTGIRIGDALGVITVRKAEKVIDTVEVIATEEVLFEEEKQAFIPFGLKVIMALLIPIVLYIGFVIFYNQRYQSKK